MTPMIESLAAGEYIDIILDLETLATSSNALIFQIGATVLLPVVHSDKFFNIYINNALNELPEFSGEVDPETVAWWRSQPEDAQKWRTIVANCPNDLPTALMSFGRWVETLCDGDLTKVRVWGNGATADNVWLSNAYKRCQIPKPWTYKGDMCYRTLKNLYPQVVADKLDGGVAHDALDDAIYERNHLIKILTYMRG